MAARTTRATRRSAPPEGEFPEAKRQQIGPASLDPTVEHYGNRIVHVDQEFNRSARSFKLPGILPPVRHEGSATEQLNPNKLAEEAFHKGCHHHHHQPPRLFYDLESGKMIPVDIEKRKKRAAATKTGGAPKRSGRLTAKARAAAAQLAAAKREEAKRAAEQEAEKAAKEEEPDVEFWLQEPPPTPPAMKILREPPPLEPVVKTKYYKGRERWLPPPLLRPIHGGCTASETNIDERRFGKAYYEGNLPKMIFYDTSLEDNTKDSSNMIIAGYAPERPRNGDPRKKATWKNVTDALRPKQEDHFSARPSVRIVMPDHLKALLVDDWEAVTKNLQLVSLPSRFPANKVIDMYFEQEKEKRVIGSADMDLLEEVVAGLKEYFDKSLGRILLYRFEREQYYEMRKKWEAGTGEWEGKGPGDVYGVEHLCRLFGMFLISSPLTSVCASQEDMLTLHLSSQCLFQNSLLRPTWTKHRRTDSAKSSRRSRSGSPGILT